MQAEVCADYVVLPPELATYFAGLTTIEVVQHGEHLSLWRATRPQRQARDGLRAQAKADHVDDFLTMRDRVLGGVEVLVRSGDQGNRELALYLLGYAVEARLKIAVCDRYVKRRLGVAQKEICRTLDREYDLLGGNGHDLDLLWRLAGMVREDLAQPDDWDRVVQWDVSWRYLPPAQFLPERDYNEFRGSARRVCEHINQERPHA